MQKPLQQEITRAKSKQAKKQNQGSKLAKGYQATQQTNTH